MRALINASGYNLALAPLMHHRPSSLLRIVDKPIIIHVVERLLLLGIQQFDIILHHFPDKVEAVLGEGERWGVQITFHLATHVDRPFAAVIPAACDWTDKEVLIGDVEILPKLQSRQLEKHGGGSTLFFHGSRGWIGWGIVSTESLRRLDKRTAYSELPKQLKGFQTVNVNGVWLSIKTLHDWQMSNHRVLSKNAPTNLFPATARMVDSGIWISRGSILHPSATIQAPVFIGDGCQIMEGAQVGPDVVVEGYCIIDRNSIIVRSIICRESYVGEELEIYNCIVDQRTLINLALNTAVVVHDDFILAHVQPPSLQGHLIRLCQSLIALAMLFFIAPLFACLVIWYGIKTVPVVRLPASEGSFELETFNRLEFTRKPFKAFTRLPSLINVILGQMQFVGLPPRSIDEIQALPQQWRRFVLEGRVGWITTADLEPEGDPFTSEAFYITHLSFLTDIRLVFRAAYGVIKS